jgi:hypothetical protein
MADEDIDLSKDNTYGKTEADVVVPMATAAAIPLSSQPATYSTANVMSQQALTTLREQGFPAGLAKELGNTKASYPIRFWIVDNSGYVLLYIPFFQANTFSNFNSSRLFSSDL